MDMRDDLAARFEQHRAHLTAVALRMLGSRSEAEDAVQEGWLRLQRADVTEVANLGGWLTTVVARVCLDMLRARTARHEDAADASPGSAAEPKADAPDPEAEVVLADSVGTALLVVLDTLRPAERLAFVLHDIFAVPFEDIATIVDCSPAAARQLASRARSRMQGAPALASVDGDGAAAVAAAAAAATRKREIVDAFLAASRDGDFDALLAVLDPEVVLRADELAVQMAAARAAHGAPNLGREVRGARAVADVFKGRARGAQRASINGEPGAVWAHGGQTRGAFVFVIEEGRIVSIELSMDAARLGELEVEILG